MSAPGQAVAFQSAGGPVVQALIQPPYDVMPLAELVGITENPVKDSLTVRERGAALFARNCSVCHGAEGDGTGIVSAFWSQDATPPANLTGVATRGKKTAPFSASSRMARGLFRSQTMLVIRRHGRH